jgi:hypothetical protein
VAAAGDAALAVAATVLTRNAKRDPGIVLDDSRGFALDGINRASKRALKGAFLEALED